MTDIEKKIQALYYLETCSEPQDEHGTPKDDDCVHALITAAHYLIQSMFNGPEPDNYAQVLELADAYIALDEANEKVYLAQKANEKVYLAQKANEKVYLAQIKLGIDEI